MAQSIRVNFVYNILLNISSVIFPLITAPYVSRILEPNGVGIYNFSITYADYFALFALMGIPTYGMREVAKNRHNQNELSDLISKLMSISSISTLMVVTIYLLSLIFIDRLSENYIYLLLAGFGLYFSPLKINWIFQGLEEFGYITLRTLVIRLLSIISLFIFVREKNDLLIYILISVMGGIVADIWNFYKMWASGIHPRFTTNGLSNHIKPLFILFASTIAISIYTMMDTLMLGFLSDYSEVGYYNNASHLTRVIIVALTSLSTVAVPRISYYIEEKEFSNINLLINKSISFLSFVTFPIAVIIFCISSIFIPLFFGAKFEGAVIPLMIMCPLFVILAFNNLTGTQILIGFGLDTSFLYSMLVGSITNFLLNLFLIPYYGAIGASISSVIAETIVLLATLYYAKKITALQIKNKSDFYKSLIGSILIIPCWLFTKCMLDGWLLVIVYTIVSIALYICFEKLVRNTSVNILIQIGSGFIGKFVNLNRFNFKNI